MEFIIEGRRPVGRPRRTWLESVEADIAELAIDKEDVHDIQKCCEKEVQPYRKTEYKPIMIIINVHVYNKNSTIWLFSNYLCSCVNDPCHCRYV